MNYEELKEIMKSEHKALITLLELLDKQYKLIMTKEVFELDSVVNNIQSSNKEIASIELERRKVINNKSMKEIISTSNDDELKKVYKDINRVLFELKLQKDTNELLIKQQIGYTNRILNYINPRREVPTYNSYGNLRR